MAPTIEFLETAALEVNSFNQQAQIFPSSASPPMELSVAIAAGPAVEGYRRLDRDRATHEIDGDSPIVIEREPP